MSSGMDREINVRALVWFAVGLVLLTVVSLGLTWFFSIFLRGYQEAQDPPPPALAAAREPHTPPGPKLQSSPEAEMEALRAEEDSVLETWGWVDREAGIARVPVDRAIALAVGDDDWMPEEESAPSEEEAEH